MPVAVDGGSLSPCVLVAITRTVYSVPSVNPVIVCLYLFVDVVDDPTTTLVAGSTDASRDESNTSEPDFH